MKFRTLKCTTLAYLPFLEEPGRKITCHARRLLQIPHQKVYAGISSLAEGLYLDIGANHGQSIESIRLYKPHAEIVSFEILPYLATRLRLRYPDVTIHSVGLGNRAETVKIFVPAYNNVMFDACSSMSMETSVAFLNRRLKTRRPGHVNTIECPIRTLDSFNLDPTFIKIDVEGAERAVIEGGMKTINRCRPVLLVEQGERVLDLLAPLAYELHYCLAGRLVKGKGNCGSDVYLVPQ